MLFFFEEYRFAAKLLKRQRQLQEALAGAQAKQLPEGLVQLYRAALAAHEAIQREVIRLGDVVETSFGDAGAAAQGNGFAEHAQRAKAFVLEVEAYERQRFEAGDAAADPQLVQRRLELEQRRVELDSERLSLVRSLGVRQGVVMFMLGLYDRLQNEVLHFDVVATRRRLGLSGVDVGVKVGTDVLLPGTGILRDLSDAVDRYFDGPMAEDDKAQAHYLWLDTYRQAAEAWVAHSRGFLDLVPGAPPP